MPNVIASTRLTKATIRCLEHGNSAMKYTVGIEKATNDQSALAPGLRGYRQDENGGRSAYSGSDCTSLGRFTGRRNPDPGDAGFHGTDRALNNADSHTPWMPT